MMKDKYDQWLKDVSSQINSYIDEKEIKHRVLAKTFSKQESVISRQLYDGKPHWEFLYFLHVVEKMSWEALLDSHAGKKVAVKKSISEFNKKGCNGFDKWMDDLKNRMSEYLDKEEITYRNLADEFGGEERSFYRKRKKNQEASFEILFFLHSKCGIGWEDLLDGPNSEEQMTHAIVSEIMDLIKNILDCSDLKKLGTEKIIGELIKSLQKYAKNN